MTPDEIRVLIRTLVPEVGEGFVHVEGVATAPGVHTIIQVRSSDPDIDSIGALVGPRGKRLVELVKTVGGTVSLAHWWPDRAQRISHALGPLTARTVEHRADGSVVLHDPIYRRHPPHPDDAERVVSDVEMATLTARLVSELIGAPVVMDGEISVQLWTERENG